MQEHNLLFLHLTNWGLDTIGLLGYAISIFHLHLTNWGLDTEIISERLSLFWPYLAPYQLGS